MKRFLLSFLDSPKRVYVVFLDSLKKVKMDLEFLVLSGVYGAVLALIAIWIKLVIAEQKRIQSIKKEQGEKNRNENISNGAAGNDIPKILRSDECSSNEATSDEIDCCKEAATVSPRCDFVADYFNLISDLKPNEVRDLTQRTSESNENVHSQKSYDKQANNLTIYRANITEENALNMFVDFLKKHRNTDWSNWLKLPETVEDIYDLHEFYKILGRDEMTEFLSINNVNINKRNRTGWTPLHGAAFFGHFETVKDLIRSAAHVNSKDICGSSALHLAATNGHDETVKILIACGAEENSKNLQGSTPLHLAALCQGRDKTVKILIDLGADVNAKNRYGWTPLLNAAWMGRGETVKVLISSGADVNAKKDDGTTALYFAAKLGCDKTVKALIRSGAEVDSEKDTGSTPLHIAAELGHNQTVKILFRFGADINSKDNRGMTPLHLAAKSGHNKMVKTLIDRGAKMSAKDNDGCTALSFAIIKGDAETVKLLAAQKSFKTFKNCTFLPCYNQTKERVKMFMDKNS
ncbi:serine/threonine-protein phosphatase 6 regulatory ankyrin repeat subunit A-like [Sitodiplosis mosellana]|uniref:serine/threonine-protein phosphatase 6 regulatory ankyrin repeat subunit A-like n=1 Tax=Sitodiplosis mosellana TaxID=263140 RepID=UPI00244384F0|nr:serine/threonine-protein phosphatase 6 regulatory ankyrin repeat subunit A-like [Sitodiplosis mosellana]